MNNDRKNMLNPSNIFLFLNQLQKRNTFLTVPFFYCSQVLCVCKIYFNGFNYVVLQRALLFN